MELKQKIDDIRFALRMLMLEEKDNAKTIPALKEEYKQLRRKRLDRERSGGDHTQFTRRINSIKRRFASAVVGISFTWEAFCSECEAELLEEHAPVVLKQADSSIGKPIGEKSAMAQEKKAERDKYYELYQQADRELGDLNRSIATEKLHLKNFRKHWDVARMVQYLKNPTDKEFLRERSETIAAIGVHFDEWHSQFEGDGIHDLRRNVVRGFLHVEEDLDQLLRLTPPTLEHGVEKPLIHMHLLRGENRGLTFVIVPCYFSDEIPKECTVSTITLSALTSQSIAYLVPSDH